MVLMIMSNAGIKMFENKIEQIDRSAILMAESDFNSFSLVVHCLKNNETIDLAKSPLENALKMEIIDNYGLLGKCW
jgi:hypothetical protein